MPKSQFYIGRMVVKYDRKTLKEVSREITDIWPSEMSEEEFLKPLVDHVISMIKEHPEIIEKIRSGELTKRTPSTLTP